MTRNEFSKVFAFNPDIIIMILGTNDVRPRVDNRKVNNWNAVNFSKDYQAMIDSFSTIYPKPKIYLCFPTPVYKNIYNWNDGDSALRAGVIPAVRKIGEVNNLPIIDLYTQMSNQPENFLEGIHPNLKGSRTMAQYLAKAIRDY